MRGGAAERSLLALCAALVVALLATCGVRPQEAAEAVPTGAAPATQLGQPDQSSGPRLTVFFVRGAALAPVERRVSPVSPTAALAQVVDGPTRAEAATGIRTALAPEVVGVEAVGPGRTATVAVSRGFAGITGGNQLLAVAQIVWTLTALPTVEDVQFTVEGIPVEVPTDAGLSSGPVDREDLRSVAPAEPPAGESTESATPDATGSPAADSPAPR